MTTCPPHNSSHESTQFSIEDSVDRPVDAATAARPPSCAAEEIYFRALDQLADGEPGRAAILLRECIAMDPEFLDALHALIRALQDAGRPDEAINAAHQLIARAPDDVLAHTRLSILYQIKGMVPEAEAAATRAKLLGWKQQLSESRGASAPANLRVDPPSAE